MMTTAVAKTHTYSARSLLFAFVGIPVLALLSFFWLEIPDSHVWQLAFSFLVGIIIAVAFSWIISGFIRSLRKTGTPCAHWLGALVLAIWFCVACLLIQLASHVDDHSTERAGYLNSKLSAPMRATFTFDRLTAWQHDLVLVILWIVIPAIITPFLVETVSCGLGGRVWRVAARIVSRWQHWLAIIACSVALYWLTGKLTGWRPSHSVHGELISLALRLCLCYIVDFALILLLLTINSRLLAREHARRNPAAEPSANAA